MDFHCYSSGCDTDTRANLTSQLVYLTWLLKVMSAMQENIKQHNAKSCTFHHHYRAASPESKTVTLIKLPYLFSKRNYTTTGKSTHKKYIIFCLWVDILFGLLFLKNSERLELYWRQFKDSCVSDIPFLHRQYTVKNPGCL